MKTALLTGVLGQSGSYLAELLIEKGYKVVGIHRRTSNPNFENVKSVLYHSNFELVVGDITDSACVRQLILKYKPDEIYNLAAQSFVRASFEQPFHTFEVDTLGVVNFLETLRQEKLDTRFYQASTSEMFGKNYSERKVGYISNVDPATGLTKDGKVLPIEQWSTKFVFPDSVDGGIPEKYQDESTPFIPQSPYGIAKLAAHHMVRLYRESYGVQGVCGILFNHESPRRGKEFVTRKITDFVGSLVAWKKKAKELGIDGQADAPKLSLGNLDSFRDWGHAKDYVRAQYLILQQDKLEDLVVCTGETHTVREFCDLAFTHAGFAYNHYVTIDPQFYRPAEVDFLRGDCSKAKEKLGWKPEYSFKDLVGEMVEADIRRYQ